jgi:small subunit ribosomal protein S19
MRSKWKGYYVDPFLKDRIKKNKTKKLIRVFSRGSTILPEYKGKTFSIYNGKSFTKIKITKEMFFKKFGEYSITKAIGNLIHTTKKRKQKKKKKKR